MSFYNDLRREWCPWNLHGAKYVRGFFLHMFALLKRFPVLSRSEPVS